METDKLSIVIPCYNNSKHVAQAVHSALLQTYEPKEIILVDDGSNDETKKIIRKLRPKIDLLINQTNKGVSAARNVGIDAATGKYILVLDADDFFEPSFGAKAIRVFKEKNDIRLVTCYANWFWSREEFQIFKPLGGVVKDFLLESRALGNSLFLKEDWKKIDGYDEVMQKGWEDWEFFIRLHTLGGMTYVIPEVLFNYRKQKSSKTIIANKNKFELMEYIYTKHSNLYKENFTLFVKHLLKKIEKLEGEKRKNNKRPEFVLGNLLLMPLRYFKSLFN